MIREAIQETKKNGMKWVGGSDSYKVMASYPTYDVNFKNFVMSSDDNKNWSAKVIFANHAINLADKFPIINPFGLASRAIV